jgi:hypothetical protein
VISSKTTTRDNYMGFRRMIRDMAKLDGAAVEAGIFEGEDGGTGGEITMAQLARFTNTAPRRYQSAAAQHRIRES